jgi:hypothetical protein
MEMTCGASNKVPCGYATVHKRPVSANKITSGSAAQTLPPVMLHELSPAMASQPEGFHLRLLLEPCLNLSIHTAPDVQPTTK